MFVVLGTCTRRPALVCRRWVLRERKGVEAVRARIVERYHLSYNTRLAATSLMIAPETGDKEKERLREVLLSYCKRDTEVMVLIFDALG